MESRLPVCFASAVSTRRFALFRTSMLRGAAVGAALMVGAVVSVNAALAHPGHRWSSTSGAVVGSHQGATGSAHRSGRTASYAKCVDDSITAPIDFSEVANQHRPILSFAYTRLPVTVEAHWPTVQVTTAQGSSMGMDGKPFTLQQMHFHVPAENRISGQRARVEVHLVHRSPNDGTLTVLSLMLRNGPRRNVAWQPMVRALRRLEILGSSGLKMVKATFSWRAMLPEDRTGYSYAGDRAPEGCAGGVTWIALRQPVRLSADQLAAFTATSASATG